MKLLMIVFYQVSSLEIVLSKELFEERSDSCIDVKGSEFWDLKRKLQIQDLLWFFGGYVRKR
jgi:hypothetical protein